jgi:hypothetical protein
MSKHSRRLVSAVVAGAVCASLQVVGSSTPASGFCAQPDWEWSGNITVGGSPRLQGQWGPALGNAADRWDNIASTGNWRLTWNGVNNSGLVQIFLWQDPPGIGGNPAVTRVERNYSSDPGRISDGDIYMDSDWNWNTNGNMNQANMVVDVGTVITHEIGHNVYLNHPGQCGGMSQAEQNSAMNPQYQQKWYINDDDRAGAAFRK